MSRFFTMGKHLSCSVALLLLSSLTIGSTANAGPILVQTQVLKLTEAINFNYGNPEIDLETANRLTSSLSQPGEGNLEPFNTSLGELQEIRITAAGYIRNLEFQVNNEYNASAAILRPTIFPGFQIWAYRSRFDSKWITSVLGQSQTDPNWAFELQVSTGVPENPSGPDVSDHIDAPEDVEEFVYYLDDTDPMGTSTTDVDRLDSTNLSTTYFSIFPDDDIYSLYFQEPISLRILPDALGLFDITTTPDGVSIPSYNGNVQGFRGTGDLTLTVQYLYLTDATALGVPASLGLLGFGLLGLWGRRFAADIHQPLAGPARQPNSSKEPQA